MAGPWDTPDTQARRAKVAASRLVNRINQRRKSQRERKARANISKFKFRLTKSYVRGARLRAERAKGQKAVARVVAKREAKAKTERFKGRMAKIKSRNAAAIAKASRGGGSSSRGGGKRSGSTGGRHDG